MVKIEISNHQAIEIIRNEFTAKGAPSVKGNRAMRGKKKTEGKKVMASIFSTYNLSGQLEAFKRSLDSDDMEEICSLLDAEQDNTLIVLYQRGALLESSPEDEQHLNHSVQTTRIRHNSVF